MTSSSVIKTKLFPPVSRSSLVQRCRLLKVLEENKTKKLTLVAAPAGFGKTTILGQWFGSLETNGESTCWYSLDHEDNDPARFLRHTVGALRSCADIGIDIIRQLDTTLIADITDVLPSLVNGLADSHKEITLVIDDFHYISSEQIHHFVELLINLSPANFHLIISGRIRPPLSLSSLRVGNELCEITANHLRFDADEAKDFMYDVVGLDLSPEHLDSLYGHSEGWAAGLQLASLSLYDPSRRDQFIASFSGSLRDIADYLASDVLDQQTTEVRDFLLRTSILERLCPGACNALTKNQNGQKLLQLIETGNLFLVPLDETNEWYRYHHLFQEFLRSRLRRIYPGEIVLLYKRAAEWFAQSDHINEAVNYALLAGDMNKVGSLVHTGTMENMSMEGRMADLLPWVNSIPQNVKMIFPRLLIQECLALSHLCRPVEAADIAEQAKVSIQELDRISDYNYTDSDIAQIRKEEAVLPCVIAFCKDDVASMAVMAEQAMNTDDGLILGMAYNFLGYSDIEQCRLDKAHEHLAKAKYYHIKKGSYYGAVFSDFFITRTYLLQYNLHNAWEHATSAEKMAHSIEGGHEPALAKAKVAQAIVYYEKNKLDIAQELLESYLPFIEDVGQISITQYGFLTLARCYIAKRQIELAHKTLNRCLLLSQHTNMDYINLFVELEKLKLSAISTDNNSVSADEHAQLKELVAALEQQWDRVIFMRLWLLMNSFLQRKKYEIFQQHYDRIQKLFNDRGLSYFKIKLLLLNIITYTRMGQMERACDLLTEVIDLVYPEDGIRIILDAGFEIITPLEVLNLRYANVGEASKLKFIERLLTLAKNTRHDLHGLSNRADELQVNSLIEPVSDREIQILELLAKGKSNAKISATLLISENTVKWHMKNVFAKLGVSNRTGAVVTAQQYGLV